MVAVLLIVALLAPTSVLAGSAAAAECHGCCPEVIRAADLPNCCVVAPEVPAPTQPVTLTAIALPLSAPVPSVVVWAQPPVPVDLPVTGDPPLRSIPLLLQTSILLI